jgi:PAS domain S-box-containing protein
VIESYRHFLSWLGKALGKQPAPSPGGGSAPASGSDRPELQLRESEARFRGLVENACVGIYRTSTDARFLVANPAMIKIMGYTSFEELATLSFEDKANQKEYPRDEFRKRMERDGFVIGWETWWTRPDGTKIFVRESATAIRDAEGRVLYYDGILEDISQSKKATEQALGESEERFRTLASATFEGIAIVEDEKWVDVNDQILRMLGYRRSEMLGRPAIDFVSPEYRDVVVESMRAQSEEAYEFHLLRKDGTSFPVEARARIVREGDRTLRMTAFRDITDQRQFEQRQRSLEEQMRQMQKMEALGTLAGGIAHDFNNILTGILGNLQLAGIEMSGDHPAFDSVSSAEQAARRARELVSRILSFSSPTQGKKRVAPMGPTVLEAVKLLRAGMPGRVQILADIDPDCPDAEFDPGQIHQVIMNLGTNSAHAMGEAGGEISIALRCVEPSAELIAKHPNITPAHAIRLDVSDNGRGMGPEVIQRIFEPFYTTKEFGKGTGLGLAMVHMVMRGHNGAITVESKEGVGSTFSLYFPRPVKVPDDPVREVSTPESAELAPFGDGRAILLVDDEDAVRIVGAKILKRLGFVASSFAMPGQALDAFRAAPASFSAVISDIAMPEMTGLELASKMLSIRNDTPIILISGNFKVGSTRNTLPPGVSSFISKPFDARELADAIRTVLERISREKAVPGREFAG